MCRTCQIDQSPNSISLVQPSSLKDGDRILVQGRWNHLYTQRITSISVLTPHANHADIKYRISYYDSYQRRTLSLVLRQDKMVQIPNKTDVRGPRGDETYEMRLDAVEEGQYVAYNRRLWRMSSCERQDCHCGGSMFVVLMNVFTSKVLETVLRRWDMVTIPIIETEDMQLLDISDDGFLSLMGKSAEVKDDVRVANEIIGEAIKKVWRGGEADNDVFVTVLMALGKETAVSVREAKAEPVEEVVGPKGEEVEEGTEQEGVENSEGSWEMVEEASSERNDSN